MTPDESKLAPARSLDLASPPGQAFEVSPTPSRLPFHRVASVTATCCNYQKMVTHVRKKLFSRTTRQSRGGRRFAGRHGALSSGAIPGAIPGAILFDCISLDRPFSAHVDTLREVGSAPVVSSRVLRLAFLQSAPPEPLARMIPAVKLKLAAAVDAKVQILDMNTEFAVHLTGEDIHRSQVTDPLACVAAAMDGLCTGVDGIRFRKDEMMGKLRRDFFCSSDLDRFSCRL